MNILFLTLGKIEDINEKGIYTDLIREFKNKGHNVFVVTPREKRMKLPTQYCSEYGVNILRVKIGNIQKVNLLEKGISTLLIEYQYLLAIRKYLNKIKFDLIIYSTPPITFEKVIKLIKKKDGATSYLLLKDIFPQNTVDMRLIKNNSLLYRFFRNKEKKLYKISDFIGCMSLANKKYLLKNNEFLDFNKIEICPNSICPQIIKPINLIEKNELKTRLRIPLDAKILIYGGNLGKPQGIPFLINIIKNHKERDDIFYLVIGSGTEYDSFQQFIEQERPKNCILKPYLPKEEYERFLKIADIGLIFLDYKFTIPNFPSRLLNYMEYSLPILAAVDPNTDIGWYLNEGKFGYDCSSNSLKDYNEKLTYMLNECDISLMQLGKNAREYLEKNYTVQKSVEIIINQINISKEEDEKYV